MDLLHTPINQLGLTIAGSILEPLINQLYKELEEVGIWFKPLFYLSDEWGCVDFIPVIGIPFYLAHPELKKIVDLQKGGEQIPIYLRHEAGHAFNYAYSLYNLPRWQEIFGDFYQPYNDDFTIVLGTDDFVDVDDFGYAQKHPDEDFAETFAIVTKPDSHWQEVYRNTGAFRKLVYVEELIKKFGRQTAPPFSINYDIAIESLTITLEKWLQQNPPSTKPFEVIILAEP